MAIPQADRIAAATMAARVKTDVRLPLVNAWMKEYLEREKRRTNRG